MSQTDDKQVDERRGVWADRSESFDEELEEAERSLAHGRKFLSSLSIENGEMQERAEEIAMFFERERNRIRSKKTK